MKKIFIFSTDIRNVNVEEFREFIKLIPSDYEIRTSGSRGLDSIAVEAKCPVEVHIPWQLFNGYKTSPTQESNVRVQCNVVTQEALNILDSVIIGKLQDKYVKIDVGLLHGILGKDLKNPVDLIVINNTGGCTLPTTSSALIERLAVQYSIPFINLEYAEVSDLRDHLEL